MRNKATTHNFTVPGVLLLVVSMLLIAAATYAAYAFTRQMPAVEGTQIAQAVQTASAGSGLSVAQTTFTKTIEAGQNVNLGIGSFVITSTHTLPLTWSLAGCDEWLLCDKTSGGPIQQNQTDTVTLSIKPDANLQGTQVVKTIRLSGLCSDGSPSQPEFIDITVTINITTAKLIVGPSTNFGVTIVPGSSTPVVIGNFSISNGTPGTTLDWTITGCSGQGDWLICSVTQGSGSSQITLSVNPLYFSAGAAGARAITVNGTNGYQVPATPGNINVTVTPAVLDATISSQVSACLNESVTLTAITAPNDSYSWSFGAGANPSSQSGSTGAGVVSSSITYNSIGTKTHTFTVQDVNGQVQKSGTVVVSDCTLGGKLTIYGAAAAQQFHFDRPYFGYKR